MMDEAKNKLMTPEEAATIMDLRRDYVYGRGVTVEREETHLRDYWRIVRRRLWVPISIVVVTLILATIYNLRLPSIYEGVTKIEIQREDRVVDLKDLQINMGGGDDAQYINTKLKTLQGPKIAYLVAKALDLEHNSEFLPGVSRPLNSQPEGLQVTEGESDLQVEMQRLENFINVLLANVEIKPVRETRLVEILYRHRSPDLARRIADTWAEAFIKNSLEERYATNREAAVYLDKSIADYKLRLKEAEERLQNYLRDHQILDFGQKEGTTNSRLSELNHILLQSETERKNAQLAYELSRSVSDVSTLPEIQRDQIVQELNIKITELRQQRERLLVEFTPEWPDVKKVSQQLQQLEGELRASHQRILSTLENQYRTAVQREDGLRKTFAQQRAETMQQSHGAIDAKMLQAEVDSNRQLLDSLLQSQKGVEVSAAGLMKSNIRIAEVSPIPRVPVAPKRAQNVLLSVLLALVGGVGLVLFLDYLNNRIESVEDIDRYLRLPALGVIPALDNTAKARRLIGNKSAAANGGNGEMLPARVQGGDNLLLTNVEANSSLAESYRQLRTSLLLSSASHAPRTLLITSSQPAEGKTTTSVNTAISLAQTGASVLIIDADLRRPRVHRVFGLKNNAGLSNYLAGETDLGALIQVAMPNLYVLPVGPLPPNPAELLGSPKMKQLVETLSANFDHVVIDSPPVSSFADSLILSALVDGVMIVVKAGTTSREMAQRTKAHLQSVGAKLLGVVINQIKLQPHDYYYSSTYYNRYYYGNDDDGGGKNGSVN
ncbi:MAG TPA: polysaccharide biosynthesis tyrosine autokinase [Blastocatellia bacterium]|nr:polysaccharide biosynthesis tyrosine autokinase [Blastocatellia bacterium]HMV82094.1 polysaccharide biosynthesis tyrosine autokinase [Blastocatellia bacterium]HMX24422.1 polysaccharide biosynthesis tyrosine autokinase [Blastocatellia bacterium]HMY72200.1 polysaccharide biosynthesis tyrosine autokinase [Blastocatellia bacterium]